MASKGQRITQLDQAAQGAFAIRCGGVEQNAGHRPTRLTRLPGIKPFADTGRRVPTIQHNLPHQGMGQRVQQHQPNAGETLFERF